MNGKPLLEIEDLVVEVEGKRLLDGIDMEIREGEIHVVFGPNGSGKSSLINTIMGLPPYRVTHGEIRFRGESLLDLSISERAKLGISLAFQQPPAVNGVSLSALFKAMGIEGERTDKLAKDLDMGEHLNRDINAGFSGGEMKRGEMLQLLAQEPELILLDEPESGVDVDSIQLLTQITRRLFQKEIPIRKRTTGGIIVTHTGSVLEHLHAHRGHVMINGKLMCSGAPLDIFTQIRRHGFGACIQEFEQGGNDHD